MNKDLEKSIDKVFPFSYSGGGYFRRNGVKVGVSAPILHGSQAIEYLYRAMQGEKEEDILKSFRE